MEFFFAYAHINDDVEYEPIATNEQYKDSGLLTVQHPKDPKLLQIMGCL